MRNEKIDMSHDEPSITTLQETINLLIKTYGDNWKDHEMGIIMASIFDRAHMDLHTEYTKTKTIKGEFCKSSYPYEEEIKKVWIIEEKNGRKS